MRTQALILLFLALAVSGRSLLDDGSVTGQDALDRPGKPESPEYKVLNKTSVYELREYKNATWAISFGRSRFLTDLAAIKAGLGLAKYFGGANAAHVTIDRTVPIVGTILRPPPPPHKNHSHPEPPPGKNGSHHGHGKHHPHPHPPPGPPTVALAAYIPKKFEGDAPIPDCPHVKILHTNTSKVYSHRFGGWAISFVVRREIRHLALALKEEGICAFKGKFFVASYNGPWKVFGRHNEVWWVKRPKHYHNDTLPIEDVMPGLEAIDVQDLFPEEFEAPEPPPEDPAAGSWALDETAAEAEAAAFNPFAEPSAAGELTAGGGAVAAGAQQVS